MQSIPDLTPSPWQHAKQVFIFIHIRDFGRDALTLAIVSEAKQGEKTSGLMPPPASFMRCSLLVPA